MFSFIKNYEAYPDGLEVWQVSVILNIAPDTVRRQIRNHKLPAYKLGRSYLVNKSDLRRFIESAATSSGGCNSNGV